MPDVEYEEAYARLTPKNQQRVDSHEQMISFWVEKLQADTETKVQFIEMLQAALSEEFNSGLDEAQGLVDQLAKAAAPSHQFGLKVAANALAKLSARNRGMVEPKLAA